MKRDMIILKIVQALEKGLIQSSQGWNEEKAQALIHSMSERPKMALPADVTGSIVFETIQDILVNLSDAEEEYIPKWAKPLLS